MDEAQVKFNDSIESLDNIKERSGEKILIPLTSSLYVPGTLGDVDKVIVDIGTGYMMDKSIPDAKNFYKAKVGFLKENLDSLQETISQRESQYKVLTDVMNMKMSEAAAQTSAKK
ncbi:Prefoldin subunit 5 [Entophlyctis luteolus]|nr:Prefoldin subunit 5 [Entophlyctis luteolus]